MAVIALLFQMPRSRIRNNTRRMWSEVAMVHAIAEYNYGRMKLATAVKECAVRRTTSGREAAEYGGRQHNLVAYKRNSALGFENEKFREHIFKLQRTGHGMTLAEFRRAAFKFIKKNGVYSKFSAEKYMVKV